jgi:hypothetical protein
MLELRKKDGSIFAIAYGFIDRMQFDPTEGITLRSGQSAIRIKGRGLNAEIRPQVRLFQGLTRHRVSWVQEADATMRVHAAKNAVLVDAIEC